MEVLLLLLSSGVCPQANSSEITVTITSSVIDPVFHQININTHCTIQYGRSLKNSFTHLVIEGGCFLLFFIFSFLWKSRKSSWNQHDETVHHVLSCKYYITERSFISRFKPWWSNLESLTLSDIFPYSLHEERVGECMSLFGFRIQPTHQSV